MRSIYIFANQHHSTQINYRNVSIIWRRYNKSKRCIELSREREREREKGRGREEETCLERGTDAVR